MNPKVKNVGERVMKQAGIPEEEEFGSIIAILMIISIILTLIRVLQECNKNKLSSDCTARDKYSLYGEEIKNYSIRKGWFTKLRIKKVLRQNMSKEQYSKYSMKLISSLLDNGENLKDDEIMALVETSNV
jgi:hypothetical protein